MDRFHQRRVWLLPLALAAVVPLSGCKIIIGTLLMITGRPAQECEFKKQAPGESLVGKDKKVVVLCAAPDSARLEYGGLDVDIITHVSRSLQETGVKVADSQKVATWLDDHGVDLESVRILEVAEKFKANYVILVHFDHFSFREPNSPNMLRGQTRGNVSVTKIETENGVKEPRRIFSSPFTSTYPQNQPLASPDREISTFRLEYVQRVGEEIGRLFRDYRPEEAFQ